MVNNNMPITHVFHINQGNGRYFEPGFTEGYIRLKDSEGVKLGLTRKATKKDFRMPIGDKVGVETILNYIYIEPLSAGDGKFIIENTNSHENKILGTICCVTVSFPVSLACDADRNGKIDKQEKKANWIWGKDGYGDILMVNNNIENSPGKSASPDLSGLTRLVVQDTGRNELPHGLKLRLSATPRAAQRFAVYRRTSDGKLELILGKDKTDKKITKIKYPGLGCKWKELIELLMCIFKNLFPSKKTRDISLSEELSPNGETLWVEAHEFPGPYFEGLITVELQLRQAVEGKPERVLDSDRVVYRVAPWIMIPNTMPVEKVYTCEIKEGKYTNNEFIKKLKEICEDKLKIDLDVISRGKHKGDRWIQDQIEIGYTENINHRAYVVFNSPRMSISRGGWFDLANKEDKAKELVSNLANKEDRASKLISPKVFQLGGSKPNSLDSFGNLEVSPRVKVNGKDYPLGRIIFGGIDYGNFSGKDVRQMMPELRQFLYAQKVQSPIEIFTDWLVVGHVDEILCFIPDSDKEGKGFKVLLASPDSAKLLLTELSGKKRGSEVMFEGKERKDGEKADITVDKLLENKKFWERNELFQGYMNKNRDILADGLGLEREKDFINIPVLFEDKYKDGVSPRTCAYFPNMVNHLVIGNNHIVPKPFGPKINDPSECECECENRCECEFEKAFCIALKKNNPQCKIWFIDDWNPYFRHIGDIHCATNVQRKIPGKKWWVKKPDGGFNI